MEKITNMFWCQQMELPSGKSLCICHVFGKWAVIECVVAGICLSVLREDHSSVAAHIWPYCH